MSIALPQTDALALPALRQVQSSTFSRRIARVIMWVFLTLPIALAFVPWQQSVSGTGQVIANDPMMRPQILQAPIYGRIMESWVFEGKQVAAGEKLMRIEANDAELPERYRQQIAALVVKLKATKDKTKAYSLAVEAFELARTQAMAKAASDVKASEEKKKAEQNGLAAAVVAENQSSINLQRQITLKQSGIVSGLDAELADRRHKEDLAKLEQARNYVAAAEADVAAKKSELEKVDQEAQAKIGSARAAFNEAQGDVANAQKDLVSAESSLANIGRQLVIAPVRGRIVQVFVNQGAEMLKEGTPLMMFVPDTEDLAVQLWVDGNDAPLIRGEDRSQGTIRSGDKVRLQFEGWPAVQFTGWPSVAVGTFGGLVKLVDATDNGKGKFRVLIVPDPDDDPWPSTRFLRQGTRANGWVLLRQVTLGFELWRQLNGFPPVIDMTEPKPTKGEGK